MSASDRPASRPRRARRAWTISRGCRCSSRSRASGSSSQAAVPERLEGRAAVGRRRAGRRLCRRARPTTFADIAAHAPRGPVSVHARAWQPPISPARRSPSAALTHDADAARFAQAARSAGVPVNVIDKPQVLRLCIRRDRQSLAAGDRHFDRRRSAGVRPGDPGQARSAAAARLCGLGGGRATLARGGQGFRPFVRSAPALLAIVHRRRDTQSGTRRRPTPTSQRLLASDAQPGAGGRSRIGHPGRRRPRRSGIADAAARCARCNPPT